MRRSKLIDDLIDSVAENSEPVSEICAGRTWTVVNGRYCGMSKTYGITDKQGFVPDAMDHLVGMQAAELAEYAHSWNMVEASIGCAAILSMVAPRDDVIEINAQDIIMEKSPGAEVVVIGAFPFISRLRNVAGRLTVLELDPMLIDPANGIYPSTACEYCIPECDVLAITGSALINKSMEHLLELGRKSRAYIVILGPSTVMSDVLFEYGADVLGGTFINNPESLLRKIGSGFDGMVKGLIPEDMTYQVITQGERSAETAKALFSR